MTSMDEIIVKNSFLCDHENRLGMSTYMLFNWKWTLCYHINDLIHNIFNVNINYYQNGMNCNEINLSMTPQINVIRTWYKLIMCT